MADTDLVSVDELKEYLPVNGTAQDTALGNIITRATGVIESYLDRELVSRGAITEYHVGSDAYARGVCLGPKLYLRQYPILEVTSVHESDSRVYDATTLLAATDYVVGARSGLLTRVGGATSGPQDWLSAYRGVRVVYEAGYADTASVPAAIKDACLRLCALVWAEVKREQHGVSSLSDALGNVQRFTAARLTDEVKQAIDPFRRIELVQTGEVDE